MKQAPGFTAAAVAILALGLGLTSAVASLAYALFLKPLPVDDASQVVFVGPPENARRGFPGAFPDYLYYRDHARVFAHLAAHYSTSPMNVITPAGPLNASGAVVTANYFDLLRLTPAIGRFFLPDEDHVPGRNPVAVLSHDLWRTKFGADAGILGTSVRINGTAFTVVGIAPEGFHGILSGLTPNDVWIPSAMFGVGYRYCDGLARGCNAIGMVGRLNDRVSIQEAQAEMAVLARQLDSTFTGGVRGTRGPRHPDRGAGAERPDRRAAGWRRRARADHRVGERRRAVARARPPPPEGDRDPPGPGRQPQPRHSSAARRVRRAGVGGQRGGTRRGRVGHGYPARLLRLLTRRRRGQSRSRARPAHRAGGHRRCRPHRRAHRHLAGASVDAAGHGGCDEGGVGRRRHAPFEAARRPDRRSGGVVRGAPRRQRPSRAQLLPPATRARFRSGCARAGAAAAQPDRVHQRPCLGFSARSDPPARGAARSRRRESGGRATAAGMEQADDARSTPRGLRRSAEPVSGGDDTRRPALLQDARRRPGRRARIRRPRHRRPVRAWSW